MKKNLSIILFLLSALCLQAAETVTSPDGRLSFSFEQSDELFYTIARDGKTLIDKSRLGVAIDNHLFESALGVPNEERQYCGEHWCDNLRFIGVDRLSKDTLYTMPYGEWNIIPQRYNEMTVRFMKGQDEETKDGGYVKSKCYFFNIKVRAYNEGIAFCYEFPETSNGLFINITDELTEFNLPTDSKALCTSWAQGLYQWRSLADAWTEQAERPLSIRLTDNTAMSLLEARCVDYARTKFIIEGADANNPSLGRVRVGLYSGVEIMTPFATPWRLIMIADKMTDLCNHDYMVLNLNDAQAKCEPKGSTCMNKGWGWIQPGKVFRCDLNRKAIEDGAEFAQKHGMQFIHLDAGWYGPEMRMESSATAVAPTKDFTIREAAQIAAAKGIGLFVYVNQRALYKDLDGVLDSLKAWGVRGVKFGFVQVGNQQWTTWLHEAIRKCADHHLMVDIHDEYRPTGYSRTYPNLMTAEGIAGNEEMPTATHNVTLPFTRFLCGPADYTLCYFNGRVKTTYAHQLAMAAVYYSPLTWMFWYDKPHFCHDEKELDFWKDIPTTWNDTKVLQGEPGEYIVTARRSGNRWFVGAMNNGEPTLNEKGTPIRTPQDAKPTRTITLPLTFLEKDVKYIAYLYEDDPTLTTRTKVRCSTKEVSSADVLTLPLLNSGGAAIKFEVEDRSQGSSVSKSKFDVAKQLKYCGSQVRRALKMMKDYTLEARNIYPAENAWNLRKAIPEEWCAGFWPGVLWMDYSVSRDKNVLKAAKSFTQPIIDDIISKPVYDHDLGFITINSLIKGYEALQGQEVANTYKTSILKAADMLASLYNDKVGTILSWPRHIKDFGGHNTIMDNMINLELLYWASENGGSRHLADIATKHAETTMENHFRPDGSCYHVCVYDTLTGKSMYCQTHQGFADYSMWSRGQSWAIYGYTTVYRYTKDRKFLDFAEKVTDIYLKRLHETSDDWVPLWDMDARPTAEDIKLRYADSNIKSDGAVGWLDNVPKDVSTACVVASALIELSNYVDSSKAKVYYEAAMNMLTNLSLKGYLSGKKNVSFLLHSTGNHPAGSEIDASIIYADYYYLEALERLRSKSKNFR